MSVRIREEFRNRRSTCRRGGKYCVERGNTGASAPGSTKSTGFEAQRDGGHGVANCREQLLCASVFQSYYSSLRTQAPTYQEIT
jgi:hypothetical protein